MFQSVTFRDRGVAIQKTIPNLIFRQHKTQGSNKMKMTYDIFDKGYAITLVRNDGIVAHLQGDDATYFRDEFQSSPSDWNISKFIDQFGYDVLFEQG